MPSPAARLRALLQRPGILPLVGVGDALGARLAAAAGFEAVFMSGFAVAAHRLGLPDTGLISYGEMLDQGRAIIEASPVPVLGDGDTGFGNAMNLRRTVAGYAAAGFACVMLEDQVSPKRCGHTQGKQVVDRETAEQRIRAAVEARSEGVDILIMARTDARAVLGLEEALARCRRFQALGADITFLEAPESRGEMQRYCHEVPGWKMANLVEDGHTPCLPLSELEAMGFAIAVHPLTGLNAAIRAMGQAYARLAAGEEVPADQRLSFTELQAAVGFDEYRRLEGRYRGG